MNLYSHKKPHIRLEEITEFFIRGGRSTTKALALKYNVTTKTIQDDLKKLYFCLKKEKTVYYLPQDKMLELVYEKEDMALSMMVSIFNKAMPSFKEHSNALVKKAPKYDDIFLFDFNFEEIEDIKVISQIVSYINQGVSFECSYKNNKNEIKPHSLYPLKIANFEGYWYMLGYDLTVSIIKTFRLNNLRDIELIDEDPLFETQKVELRNRVKNTTTPWISENTKKVQLLVKGDCRRYFKRKKYNIISIDKDDNLVVELEYFNDTEAIKFILNYLQDITILNNDELSEKIKKMVLNSPIFG